MQRYGKSLNITKKWTRELVHLAIFLYKDETRKVSALVP